MPLTEMTDFELGWLIGLLEGEGCISVTKDHRVQIFVGMTDEDVVRRIHRVTGVGAIGKQQRRGQKTIWRWIVSTRADVANILSLAHPHLGHRRAEKAMQALATLEKMASAR